MTELRDLTNLIQSIVAPQAWAEVGGPGAMACCPHIPVLLVEQTGSVHEQIVNLLTQLRTHLAAQRSNDGKAMDQRQAERMRLAVYALRYGAPSNRRSLPAHSTEQAAGKPDQGNDLAPGEGSVPLNTMQTLALPRIPEAQLVRLIRDLIEPESWSQRSDAYLNSAPQRLIVRHTDAVHRQICELAKRLGLRLMPLDGTFLPNESIDERPQG